jgi:hypothetical protein
MKLYTEEQLLNSMNSVRYYINHYNENVIDKIIDNHIKALGAIELPSDEEIENKSIEYSDRPSYIIAFEDGAHWVLNHINQQKDIDVPLSKQPDK